MTPGLYWLPRAEGWREALREGARAPDETSWRLLRSTASSRLDFVETMQLDRVVRRLFPEPPAWATSRATRLALLGSSTMEHLLPGLRIGALRRGIWLSAYTSAYGQYLQEIIDPASALHALILPAGWSS